VTKWLIAALLVPTAAFAAADPCKPIGRTEDGKLVYSMKCENLPVPPRPAAAATPAPATAPAQAPVDDDPGGLFGHAPSFIRPTNTDQFPPGVGPAAAPH